MYNAQPEVMWQPDRNSGKAMLKFKEKIQSKYKVKLNDYWDLHKWSVENIPEFWAEVWDLAEIIHSKSYDKVVDRGTKCSDMPSWFHGARLNYAENLLKFRDNRTALIVAGEERKTPKYVSHAKLYEEACLYGAAMRKFGIKKGDCLACYMSNRDEPIYAMIGATSIGALWTGALPLLGAQAALNRFRLTKPKILFTVDRFINDGEEKEMLEKVKEVAKELPSLEKVVIVPSTPESTLKDISGIPNSCFLEEFLELGRKEDGSVPPLEFEQLPFDHPIYISYTSGTTGSPKALVHGIGGLISMARDFWLHNDAKRGDVFLSMSPVGWMTWNLFATLLALGVTVVVFEGVPYYLSPTFLWDMVDEFKISTLFLTPNILDELEKRGYLPTAKHHLSSLETVLSAAAVVKPQNYEFVYKKLKPGIKFGSCYGSTELMGASMLFEHTLPIHKGEISAPALGVDVKCFSDSGQPLIGEVGEMVVTTPAPSFPLGLWGDKDGTKYREVYCSQFPGNFSPGDLCLINPKTKGIIVYGRSDDTLKPKGTRFGSVEIYNIVETFEEIYEALCVSQYNKDRDERAVLFVKMHGGYKFNEELVQRIRSAIEKELTIKHVPEIITEAKEIPRNMNGKKMEILVKKIINKMPYNSDNVINPESLPYYQNVPELRGLSLIHI